MQFHNLIVNIPYRCVFAIPPTLPGQPANMTRNVVYKEVLTGIQPAEPEQPSGDGPIHEVSDIAEWLDYDTAEVEGEEEINDEAITEASLIQPEETRQRVQARERQPVHRQRSHMDETAQSMVTPSTNTEPLCEYEKIRECNIQEIDARFYEEFGYHIREARSTARGVLGHEEVDSDTEGEEEQVYEHMKQKGLNTLYLRNDAPTGAK